MQRIYKFLTPGFLRRWDAWLLERYPMVWRTRGHYVLYFALLATPVLFLLGFFYPVSATKLTIDPIMPIIMGDENFYILPLAVLSLGILYWAYTQYQSGFPSAKPKHVLLTLLVYAGCLFVIMGITAPAFYLGAMLRSGYFLIEEEDIKYWADNDYFLYGIVLKESDSTSMEHDVAFFQEREPEFKRLWRREQYILKSRYKNHTIDSLFDSFLVLHWINRPKLDLPDLPGQLVWYRSDRLGRSHRLNLSFLSYKTDLSYKSDLQLMQNLRILSYVPYLQIRGYLAFESDDLDFLVWKTYFGNMQFLSYQSDYWRYYEWSKLPQIKTSVIERYQIPIRNDTVKEGSFTSIRPAYLNDMEDAIRSVHHAQQYIREGILFRHWQILLYYLPLLALLLFTAPYLSIRTILVVFIFIGLGGASFIMSIRIDQKLLNDEYYRNSSANLLITVIGLLYLALSAVRGNFSKHNLLAFHLIVFGIAAVLFFAIMGEKWVFAEESLSMNKPSNLAFFGVQAIGLAGVLLMAYLQALPKRE